MPRWLHETLQTVFWGSPLNSHSLVTLELQADQRYTHAPSPTASVFWLDQSTRFR